MKKPSKEETPKLAPAPMPQKAKQIAAHYNPILPRCPEVDGDAQCAFNVNHVGDHKFSN